MTLLGSYAPLASLAAGMLRFVTLSRGDDVYENIKMVSLLFKDALSPSFFTLKNQKTIL